MTKEFSGRKFLTVCCGLVFVYGSITGYLPKDIAANIIVMVFTLYFSRERENTKGG